MLNYSENSEIKAGDNGVRLDQEDPSSEREIKKCLKARVGSVGVLFTPSCLHVVIMHHVLVNTCSTLTVSNVSSADLSLGTTAG